MSSDASHLETIYFAALEIQDPEARGQYLAEACGQDDELRERVVQMLAVQSKVDSFMEHPPTAYAGTVHLEKEILDAGLSAGFGPCQAVVIGSANHSVLKSLGRTLDEVPRVLLRDPKEAGSDPIVRPRSKEIPADHADSRYQLAGEIARGGMGAIIKGRDIDLGRDLAIKVLLDAHKDKPEVVQRFIEEAQIGGQLQHPGIVPVYELGQFGDQRPFFSMKLVKGETLAGLLSARKSPAEDRAKFLGIFEQVCQTMAYAHSRGVIHRDLKPANIMVGAFGEVQVMDWGLAKVLAAGGIADEKKSLAKQTDVSVIQTRRSLGSDSPGSVGSLGSQTQMGSVMGTPAYMSPEQALGEVDRLDERTDVFGLGAILCEILTGKPPYVASSGEQVFRMASRGKLEDCYARLDACEVDADLRQIVRNALALEPDDRLRDAGTLSKRVSEYLQSVDNRLRQAELERHQAITRSEETRKRQIVVSALAASLLVGVIASTWFAFRASEQQKLAEVARLDAVNERTRAEKSQQAEVLQREKAEAAGSSEAAQRIAAEQERDKARALSEALALEKQELSRQKEEQRRMLYISDMNRIQNAWEADNVGGIIELLDAHRPQPGQIELRGFEWHYWNRLCHSDLQTVQAGEFHLYKPLMFSPDGRRLAGVQVVPTEVLTVLDVETGVKQHAFDLQADLGQSISYAWHPDGTRLLVTINDQNNLVRLIMWDIAADKTLFTINDQSSVRRRLEFGREMSAPWFSNDGTRFAATVGKRDGAGSAQHVLKFWDSRTGAELAAVPLPDEGGYRFSINADGSHVAFGSSLEATDGTLSGEAIKIVPIATKEVVVTIPLAGTASFLFHPDGQRLFVSGTGNTSPGTLQEHRGGVFDASTGQRLFPFSDTEPWKLSRFSPDGQWLAVTSLPGERSVKLHRTAGDHAAVEFRGHTEKLNDLSFSPDGQRLFTHGSDGYVKTWDVASIPSELEAPASATFMPALWTAVSTDGNRLATAPRRDFLQLTADPLHVDGRKNIVTIHNDSGDVQCQTAEMIGPIQWLKFSPDGLRLAACAVAQDGELHGAAQLCVWDTATGAEKLTLRLPAHQNATMPGSIMHVDRQAPGGEFSPDGRKLATIIQPVSDTGRTSSVKIWDIDTRREDWESETVPYQLSDLHFSPSGEHIVAAGPRLTVWDSGSGRMLWKAPTSDSIGGVGFSADGKQIFGRVGFLGEIKLWNSEMGAELLTIHDPEMSAGSPSRTMIVPSPNGRWLATGQSLLGSYTRGFSVKVWDVNRPDRERFILPGIRHQIQRIAFSPDSRRIATCERPTYFWMATGGATKLWDAETGQQLLTLPGAARNIAFNPEGTILIAEAGDTFVGNVHVQRWDASRLPPQVEAKQIVEAYTARDIEKSLPLASEILARIDADTLLPEETRSAAIAIVKGLRREKELNQAAWEIASLPGQPPEKYHRASQYLEEVYAIDPDNREAWSTRGMVQYRLGQFVEALAALARSEELHAAQQHSVSAEDLTVLAMTRHQAGKPDEARTTLELVRAAASRNETEWQKLLAEAETLLGIPMAADQPERWIGQHYMPRQGAVFENDQGERTNPRYPFIITKVVGNRLWLGADSVARSQVVSVEEASRYFSNWIQAEPQAFEAFNRRGIVSRFLGDSDQTIADYSAAIRLAPRDSAYLNNRGLVWLEDKHDLEKALADFDAAVQISPGNSRNHAMRALVRQEQGELDDAIRSLDKAIQLYPDSGQYYAWRAGVWSAKGDRARMQQDLDDAISRSPEDPQTLNARAWLMATSPVDEHRNGTQAVADACKACELTAWQSAACLTTLAAANAEIKDFEQAVKWQKQALALRPPIRRAEDEARLKLYLESQPFRDIPKTPPADTDRAFPPTDPDAK